MKKYYYLIQFQYLGFRYHGWQKQPDVKTVQKMIEKTVRFVLEHDDFKVLGSARTDAKVSANAAAFELFLKAPIDTESFFKVFNENLPQDIRAISVKEVDRNFNIINSPKFKEYIYLFSFGEKNHPFCAPFMTYVPENLDIPLMKEGALLFEGLHNFQNYCYKPKENTMFNREIKSSQILKNDIYSANFFPEQSFMYKVEGKGFMRHQVRLMVGALINLGKGKFDLDYIKYSLSEKIEDPLNNIAPSSGLILNKIVFDDLQKLTKTKKIMNPILNQNLFFVKEHVGMFKASNNYDIYNPETQQMNLVCREENLGFFTKMLRFTDYKRMTPFNVEIRTPEGEKVVTIKRGISFFLSSVEVYDENDILVGKFKQKFFSIGGKFDVTDPDNNVLCTLKGKWTSWDFRFMKDDVELAHVSKQWAGLGKELFTTADNYMLEIDPRVPQDNPVRELILAAVMCIDMVLKE